MSAMFKPRNPAGGLRRGAWTHEEDLLLNKCIEKFGEGSWHMVPARAGLARCRKSCRLRWLNYLKPGLKRGEFGDDEIDLILRLHYLLGNRWALIAGRIPGRTANDIKNYWNSHLSKKVVTSDRHLGRAGSQLSRNVDSPKEEEERKKSKKRRRRTAGDATAAAKKMGRVEETSKSNTTATTTTVTTDPRRITASGETSSVTVIKPQALTLAPDFCFRDKPAAAGLPRQAGIEEPWWASFCSDGGGAQGGSFGSGPTGGGDCHGAVEGREVQWEDMFLDPESLWKFV